LHNNDIFKNFFRNKRLKLGLTFQEILEGEKKKNRKKQKKKDRMRSFSIVRHRLEKTL